MLLSRNNLFNFRATFSLVINKRISARPENSTDWKLALKDEFRTIYIEALDFLVHLLDLRFIQPNSIKHKNSSNCYSSRHWRHRQNRLRFVYTHFKSCDQSLDKTSFEFSNIFHAMQSCAMSAKSSIIPKLPVGMIT